MYSKQLKQTCKESQIVQRSKIFYIIVWRYIIVPLSSGKMDMCQFVFYLIMWAAVMSPLAPCGQVVGQQEGAGHSPHHLQPCPEHDQGSDIGERISPFHSCFQFAVSPLPALAQALRGRLLYFPRRDSFVWPCSHTAGHCWKNNFPGFAAFAHCLCVFDCRDSATKCVPCTPISPSTLSSRRPAPWWKSGTSWERSTFAASEWELVRQDAETKSTLNCFVCFVRNG